MGGSVSDYLSFGHVGAVFIWQSQLIWPHMLKYPVILEMHQAYFELLLVAKSLIVDL